MNLDMLQRQWTSSILPVLGTQVPRLHLSVCCVFSTGVTGRGGTDALGGELSGKRERVLNPLTSRCDGA